MEREVDAVVVGAGPVGENAADRVRAGGLEVVLVEHELVGGECSYWACVPSMTLVRSAAALRAAQRVPGAAEAATGELDVAAVLRRRDYWVSDWSDRGAVEWVESVGIELARGHGRLAGPRRVVVEHPDGSETTFVARHAVVVCTGSDPAIPPIVGEAVLAGLRGLGATVRLGVEPTQVERDGSGEVVITLDDDSTVTADEVLVATGRKPRSGTVGLDTVGLEPGSWLDVDETMLVRGADGDGDWLYAVGDVNHRALLTHQGKYQGRAAGDVIVARALGRPVDASPWGVHVATADHSAVPGVVFGEPECVSVGLTEAAARRAGHDVRIAEVPIQSASGAGILADGYDGRARLVVDAERDVVIGATFVGQDVAELLHAATIAVVGEVPVTRLWHAVPAFPTMSEVWLRLLEDLGRPEVTA